MNMLTLVGRLAKNPEKIGDKVVIELSISRNYKNADGHYEVDFIECVLWNGISNAATEYCHKDDVIGVKGTLFNSNGELKVRAEKITFLSNSVKGE